MSVTTTTLRTPVTTTVTAAREIEIAANAGTITEVALMVSEASQAQPIHSLF